MRQLPAIALASLLALAACSGNKAATIDVRSANVAASRWTGALSTPAAMAGAVQVRGEAWMGRNDKNRIVAHVSVENATKGGVHPWHVHRGRCGYDNGVVGSASAYPLLKVGDNGNASATANVDENFPVQGDYFVNVHASADNMQTIIACANLAPPTQP